MDVEQPQITSDIDLTPEQGKRASKKTSLTLFDHKLTFEKGKKGTHCRSVPAKPTGIRKEKDIPRLTEN